MTSEVLPRSRGAQCQSCASSPGVPPLLCQPPDLPDDIAPKAKVKDAEKDVEKDKEKEKEKPKDYKGLIYLGAGKDIYYHVEPRSAKPIA